MRDLVRAALVKHDLAGSNEELWVAVSGGLDSMVLLDVLLALGHPCHVAHVDHGLRGAESDGDRTFVEQYCAEHDIPFHSKLVDVRAAMEGTGKSVQMAARDLRLTWFNELVLQGPSKLAMAHHSDDAVETFMMGLMQGMGAHGWGAIPVRNGPFIRPMLGASRNMIRAYAEANSIRWREDASNADTTYLRNRIRHDLLPKFEEWRPGTHRNLQRNLALFGEMKALAERSVYIALSDVKPDEDGSLRIPISAIRASGVPLLFLHHVLRNKGFHPDQFTAMLDAIDNERVGALFIRGDDQVLVDRSVLVVGRITGPLPSWVIHDPAEIPLEVPLKMTACGMEAVDHGLGHCVAWLDADMLEFPLTLRPWKDGDRIRPVGLGGSKLISDILIDAKVPRDKKQRTYVLVQGDRIIWLCGHRLAEGSVATSSTRRVLCVVWSGI